MPQLKIIPFLLALLATQALWAADTTKVYYVGADQMVELYEKPSFKEEYFYSARPLRAGEEVYFMPDTAQPVIDVYIDDKDVPITGYWRKARTLRDTGYVFDALVLPFKITSYTAKYANRDFCEPDELQFFEHFFGVKDSTLKNIIPFGNPKKYFKTKKIKSPYCVKRFTKELNMGFTFTYCRPDDREFASTFYLQSDNLSFNQMYCLSRVFCKSLTEPNGVILGLHSTRTSYEQPDCYESKFSLNGEKMVWEFTYYCR